MPSREWVGHFCTQFCLLQSLLDLSTLIPLGLWPFYSLLCCSSFSSVKILREEKVRLYFSEMWFLVLTLIIFHFCIQQFFSIASYSSTENVKSRHLNSSLIITLCESFGNVAFNDTITIRFEYCHDWVKKKSIRQKNIYIQTYHKIYALHTSIKLFKITQAVFKHIIMYHLSHLQATLLISSSSF